MRVRVYETDSVHKSMSALRQGSIIVVADQDFHTVEASFKEAFFTHTSTSPNLQIIASLDVARRQMELEGYELVGRAIQLAIEMRRAINAHPLISKYFRVATAAEMIPAEYRKSGFTDWGAPGWTMTDTIGALDNDEFYLDPTRITLLCGTAGYDGTQFKALLASEHDIQINKTSRNSVLVQININNTRSDLAHLIKALADMARGTEKRLAEGGEAEQAAFKARVKSLVEDVPDLPDFQRFHDAFRDDPKSATQEGHMREAYYMAYDAANCEHVKLYSKEIDDRLAKGPELVSAKFVIPYPPGFPIMVPGQVVTQGDHRVHAQARREGDPRLRRRQGPRAPEARRAGEAQGQVGGGQHDRLVLRRRCASTRRSRSSSRSPSGTTSASSPSRASAWGRSPPPCWPVSSSDSSGSPSRSPSRRPSSSCSCSPSATASGPQFVRGVAKDGLPQAIFSAVQCVLSLLVPVAIAKLAGYDLGYAAGLYSGSQTISAAMGLSTDAINRLGLAADQAKALLDSMPIAYAVTYMFGTVGSAIVIAVFGPALLRIDLPAACKEYEEKQGGTKEMGGAGSAWHRWEVRAFRVAPGGKAHGLRAVEAEALVPDARVFVMRVRRNGVIEDATADTVLREGDVVAIAGLREVLVKVIGANATEVEDPELLNVPVEGVDVYVTNKAIDGKTLAEVAKLPGARGVFLRKITRGATATTIPILPNTKIERGDILTVVGRTQDTAAAAKMLGVADRPTDVADVAFIGAAIALGALVGSLVLKVGGAPLTLSTAGGALIAGIVFGWLRSVRPSFGRIPSPTVWFMNSVGLNIFIAIVGISAGPGFVNGLKTQGIGLFLWGAVATTIPLVLGMFIAKYVFRFHDALTLGIVSGARTTTASLGLVCDMGRSQVPALGYTVTYAVGNTLLTIWGMVVIMLLS